MPWLIYTWDFLIHWWDSKTHSYVRHDSTRHTYEWIASHVSISHVSCSFTREWVSFTHVWKKYDSFIRETWLIHTWDMTHLHTWHDSSRHVTWLMQTCDTTYESSRRLYVHKDDDTHMLFDSATTGATGETYSGLREKVISSYICNFIYFYI